MKKILLLSLTILLSLTLFACKPSTTDDHNVIYVTVYPMEYLVNEIGGDSVTVKRVPGSNVHSDSIDWGAKEIIDMINADMLFYVNAGLDNYIQNNADSTFNEGDVELIDISEFVPYNQVCYSQSHDHEGEELLVDPIDTCDENMLSDDPHFWLDPVLTLKAAELVRDKLIVKYPDNSLVYQNNFMVLEAALEKLDEDYQLMADEATKPIITTNMLFSYWHARYDIEILSLTADVHSNETIPGDIIEFVDEALLHEIHYILFEANTNSPAGDQLLQQLLLTDNTAQAATIHGGGTLTNEEINNGTTYMTLMYENLEILNSATK